MKHQLTLLKIKNALQGHIDEASQATSGPWTASPPDEISETHCVYETHEDDPPIIECWNWQEKENALFVARARTLSPFACRIAIIAIEALEKECSAFQFPDEDRPTCYEALEAIVKEWKGAA